MGAIGAEKEELTDRRGLRRRDASTPLPSPLHLIPPLAHRSDRRPVGQRQEHDRPGDVRRARLSAARVAADRAVVDGLGERPIKEITRLFTAVGFSSPPSWIKPYHVLSNGEQFRCDLARALAG